MTAKFLSLLQFRTTGKLSPDNYSLAVVIHYTSQVAFLGHVLFIPLFLWLQVRQMALLNVGSCLIFLVCFRLNQRGRSHSALLLGLSEVVTHACLAVIFVGWNSGFHYYLLTLIPLMFYSPRWPISFKTVFAGLLCGLYVSLYFYAVAATPWAICEPARIHTAAAINILTLCVVLSVLGYYYQKATANAKKALRLANLKLERQAHTDPLTRLANRRSMLESLQSAIDSFLYYGIPFCLAMGDIDNFKAFNDRYGHDAGDLILVKIADLMGEEMREQDQSARWGGEEFLILLPGTQLEGASLMIERLRERIATTPITIEEQPTCITMTFGLAQYEGESEITDSIRKADRAMYKGKCRGKNCVVQPLSS